MSSNSSFSDNSNSSDSVSDISLPDVTKLKPYDFEPEASSSEEDNIDISNDDSSDEEKSRIGNVDWCVCGKCRPMQTFTESLCCRDTNEVPDDLFEGL